MLANPATSGRGPNDHWSSHHHGGVGGHGMRMMVEGVRNEISHGGASSPGSRYKRPNREACLVVGEVGGARSSDEAANPRGAKGPHLVEVSSETQDCAMASLGKIATTRKLQAFQRTLCRIAKRPTSTVHAVNDLGELVAGNPPVQFDEGWGVPGRTDNYGRLIFIRELPAYSTQLPDPTSPSVTPPAKAGDAPSVAADH